MPATYVYQCPTHGEFEKRRPMAESAEPGACPACARSCAKVIRLSADQVLLPSRFGVTIPTTGWVKQYGGGEWQQAVRDYQRWDSPFAGPLPHNDAPAELR